MRLDTNEGEDEDEDEEQDKGAHRTDFDCVFCKNEE